MTQERFDLSRRKALAALGTIGAASAGAGVGTSAYFSDEETFENNRLVAGELDLKVTASQHYVDWLPDTDTAGVSNPVDPIPAPQETDDAEMANGEADITLNPGSGADPQASPIELVLVDDTEENGDAEDAGGDEDALEFAVGSKVNDINGGVPPTPYGGSLCDIAPGGDDDAERPVIDLGDVKPGDFGFVRFAFASCDNPAFVRYTGTITSKSENGTTEPEADDPDEESGVVELLDEVRLAVVDGDVYRTLAAGNSLTVDPEARLRDLEDGLDEPVAGNLPAAEGGGTGRNCFEGGSNYRRTLVWWLPIDHGNEIQSDTATFELGLYAEQCRHNDGGMMNTDQPDQQGPVTIEDQTAGAPP